MNLEYEIPIGDGYSPFPAKDISVDRVGREYGVAGSSFGQQPQGRELANVNYALVLSRHFNASSGDLNKGSFLELLETEESALKTRGKRAWRIAEFKEIIISGYSWVYRKKIDEASGLLWSDEYCRPLIAGTYLIVRNTLWSSAAKDLRFVEESRDVVMKIVASVKVTPLVQVAAGVVGRTERSDLRHMC